MFDVFDENLVLNSKGYIVEDPETLVDLGVPDAIQVEVIIHSASREVVVSVEHADYTDYYGTGETVESLNNYLSLEDLKAYITEK